MGISTGQTMSVHGGEGSVALALRPFGDHLCGPPPAGVKIARVKPLMRLIYSKVWLGFLMLTLSSPFGRKRRSSFPIGRWGPFGDMAIARGDVVHAFYDFLSKVPAGTTAGLRTQIECDEFKWGIAVAPDKPQLKLHLMANGAPWTYEGWKTAWQRELEKEVDGKKIWQSSANGAGCSMACGRMRSACYSRSAARRSK